MFLSRDEIYRITRKRQRAAQKRVLRARGYAFEEDAAGWPLVLWTTVERRHAAANDSTLGRGPDRAALAALMERR